MKKTLQEHLDEVHKEVTAALMDESNLSTLIFKSLVVDDVITNEQATEACQKVIGYMAVARIVQQQLGPSAN